MSDILVTGFEPFGPYEHNPSERLAHRLDGTDLAGHRVIGRVLPVAFDRVRPALLDVLEECDPALVLSTGLAAGRPTLALERIGINLRDTAGTPDNDDRNVVDRPVSPDGPDAYFATLPVRGMKTAMCEAGVPTRLSTSAGTHLCNEVLYATRHLVETTDASFQSGFLHLPFSHAGAAKRDEGEPSMSLETMERGVRVGLEAALDR